LPKRKWTGTPKTERFVCKKRGQKKKKRKEEKKKERRSNERSDRGQEGASINEKERPIAQGTKTEQRKRKRVGKDAFSEKEGCAGNGARFSEGPGKGGTPRTSRPEGDREGRTDAGIFPCGDLERRADDDRGSRHRPSPEGVRVPVQD